ncbi:MAG: YebC/PmpR family DNA-binding transcriptional regulator [Alphaproteobacteria bacterium]|nr:YebC/PmpR family DNA-binding transcriptional regulator [Alphaproteobacteria bacterium]
MAGHSQFKNIMHRKGAQDARKAKLFNKIAREISVAAKAGGPDPSANPRLRAAFSLARANNMPRERIDRALKSATDAGNTDNFEAVRYEGYGPGGCAVIVECLTDNRHRTAAEVRTAFNKHGGTLGETNSVSFMFSRVGLIVYPAAAGSADAMLEAVIEAGGENVDSDADAHVITTAVDDVTQVRDALEAKFGPAEKAHLTWKAADMRPVVGEAAEQLHNLLEALDDNDDVQNVTGNYQLPD